ncbi:peptidase M48 [Actibacterium mucosum KCTC 23349]|uniref:Peptidase M48 n=1 Tax=Actibacterium mucosum KCTC 23349 TaxID=1454373 RepID=A0A037ZKL0_9RHOB|nr:M48 family metallopeptidase [Actibacterium mucosum]KAJ56179.1 peptidase M48 [Actibacterium mucosum KCTC 23349]
MWRWIAAGLIAMLVAGCEPVPPVAVSPAQPTDGRLDAEAAVRNFVEVLTAVEPVAEAECARRTTGVNCDFAIFVDADPRAAANAFQSLGRSGQPRITFTIALIAEARNVDELAFILGHEAAHHIEGHLEIRAQTAAVGAEIIENAASQAGATGRELRRARHFGAFLGARVFSQEMELEADAMGARIAALAGYDPVRGAAFFNRIPDPGETFLGTHPPNALRLQAVRKAASGI